MPNLVITGFMGTGKTAVGREVARRLDRPFVDMDSVIATRAGKPVAAIFAEDGEPAFRRMEAALCRELSDRDDVVVATGGGALVNPDSRALLMASGCVICLDASPERILHRVGGNDDRPLLGVADPRLEIERLQGERREAYAAIRWHIDTSQLTIDEVVERVLVLPRATLLPVHHPGGAYDVYVGEGMLDHVGGALRAAGVAAGTRIALVSNDVVAPLYATAVEEALRVCGLQPFTCTIPDGEGHKSLATISSLYDQFLAGGLERSGTALALGGGVTGDIAGFAASTYMRGVGFAQVPTTLLSMVDSSVGGKTGVDLPQGKNLVGAFKQPAVVVIDPRVLATLEEAEFRSGMAEVIKHGVIGAPDLIDDLEARDGATHLEVGVLQIARALRVKIEVVEEDAYERGRRAVLNLGHTVGHALEKLSQFALRHGEAVAIGMVAAARIAVALGRAEPDMADLIVDILAQYGLPVRCPSFDAGDIWRAMAHDKKRREGTLRWILPDAIGEVSVVTDVPQQAVLDVLREMGAK
ncbi:MAG: 3-dehydroquinate synthase [Anaerolineae bacterium]|jgi:3-dehydroquinate synthase